MTKAETHKELVREAYKPFTETQIENLRKQCKDMGIEDLFTCAEFSVSVTGYPEHSKALQNLSYLVNRVQELESK